MKHYFILSSLIISIINSPLHAMEGPEERAGRNRKKWSILGNQPRRNSQNFSQPIIPEPSSKPSSAASLSSLPVTHTSPSSWAPQVFVKTLASGFKKTKQAFQNDFPSTSEPPSEETRQEVIKNAKEKIFSRLSFNDKNNLMKLFKCDPKKTEWVLTNAQSLIFPRRMTAVDRYNILTCFSHLLDEHDAKNLVENVWEFAALQTRGDNQVDIIEVFSKVPFADRKYFADSLRQLLPTVDWALVHEKNELAKNPLEDNAEEWVFIKDEAHFCGITKELAQIDSQDERNSLINYLIDLFKLENYPKLTQCHQILRILRSLESDRREIFMEGIRRILESEDYIFLNDVNVMDGLSNFSVLQEWQDMLATVKALPNEMPEGDRGRAIKKLMRKTLEERENLIVKLNKKYKKKEYEGFYLIDRNPAERSIYKKILDEDKDEEEGEESGSGSI